MPLVPRLCPPRAALFFNKTRLAANTTAARARQRVLDASVAQVINFAVSKTPSTVDASAARLPVIYVGDRANNRKASRGFAMQRFLHLLARKAIVVICSEHRTTKCCGDCGHFNVQPRKAYSAVEHRGTKYCANLECPSRGRFTNRDVQAACNNCRSLHLHLNARRLTRFAWCWVDFLSFFFVVVG